MRAQPQRPRWTSAFATGVTSWTVIRQSTKPEVHNVSHSHQRNTKQRPPATRAENFLSLDVRFLRYARGHTNTQQRRSDYWYNCASYRVTRSSLLPQTLKLWLYWNRVCRLGCPYSGINAKLKDVARIFSARCNVYISCLCYDVSVRLSVTEVHWRIIANLGFKFRSHFTAHSGRLLLAAAVLLAGGSSRAMLASARLSCFKVPHVQ